MKLAFLPKFPFALVMCFLGAHFAVCQSQDASPQAAPEKKPAHRVITNDEIPSRTPGNSTPEIEARLAQLNLCDHACFAQVFKDSQLAFRQRYHYPYPFSSRDDHAFEDAILNRMDSLHHNPDWQMLLRNALIAQDGFCRNYTEEQQRSAQQRASGKPITHSDLAAEETAAKDSRSIPNYGASTSAIINYKFKIEKDPLLASIVLYKYFEIVKSACNAYPPNR
jgi:hypothetical protein